MNSNNKLKQELLETAKAPLQNDVMYKELKAAKAEAVYGGGGLRKWIVPPEFQNEFLFNGIYRIIEEKKQSRKKYIDFIV